MNFYFEASKVLDKLDAKQGSIKGVIATLPEKDRKRTAALVIETLKYKPILSDILDASKLLKEERKITSKNLALVLVHDLLLSTGIQAGDGPVKQAVLRHKTRLHSELTRIKVKKGVKATEELAQSDDSRASSIPRYVRINTNRWTKKEAIKTFVLRGYTLGDDPLKSQKGFTQDEHVPDLLAFPPQTQFVDDELYKDGKIILQDKASCFPACVLAPPADDASVVIDATAAPGNKTSHLSALMANEGKLLAFERDRKRFKTLQTMLTRAHCTNVETVNMDFLTASPTDQKYKDVKYIMLDPSCSGSGIVNRLDYLLESESDETDTDRLNKLAGFQLSMIKHAMKFPSVRRIAYSTCSVHSIENEHVVRQALKCEEAVAGRFCLAARDEVLPTWTRRGMPEELDDPAQAESLIRCSPGEDATNGFFVTMFVSGTDGEHQPQGSATTSKRELADPEEQAGRRKKRKKKKSSS